MTDAQNSPNNQNNQPVFSIEKVYVKDLSLEVPNAPQVFLEREQPTVDIQLHHNSTRVEEGVYQTVLTVTVTACLRAAEGNVVLDARRRREELVLSHNDSGSGGEM